MNKDDRFKKGKIVKKRNSVQPAKKQESPKKGAFPVNNCLNNEIIGDKIKSIPNYTMTNIIYINDLTKKHITFASC